MKRPRKEMRHLVEFPVEIRGPKRVFEASGRDLAFSGLRVRYSVHHLAPSDRIGLTLHLPVGRIELVADPGVTANCHRLSVSGAFGRLNLTIENRPLAGNPKSSEMAALSLVRAIRNKSALLSQ